MGFDYGNHHVFVGDRDAQKIRQAIIDCIHSISNRFVAQESEGDRSIVIGTPDRWIFVGDAPNRLALKTNNLTYRITHKPCYDEQ